MPEFEQALPQVPVETPVGQKKALVFLGFGTLVLLVVAGAIAAVVTSTAYKFKMDARALSNFAQTASQTLDLVSGTQKELAKLSLKDDKQVGYRAVSNMVQGWGLEYTKTNNPKVREFIQKSGEFAKKYYSDQFNESDFFVLCLDETCGKLEYKPEVLKIQKQAEQAELGPNKEGIISAIKNASYVSDEQTLASKNLEKYSLNYALYLAHLEAANGNKSAGEIETALLRYLQAAYADFSLPWATDSAVIDPREVQK